MISKRAKVTKDKPSYKKKEKSEKGNIIYRYDEGHLKERAKEKKEKLSKLQSNLKKVKSEYEKDLSSDDMRDVAIAAVIGIMEESGMRVGNEESAKEGTYGATTLKVKHVKISGNKIKFDFPGKGAIEQNIEIKNSKVVSAIKKLMKGKKSDDFIFEVDGKKIWDRAINRYLEKFDISAKDLRGFRANDLMENVLKKKDFEDALEEVADNVGHTPNVLKNDYLDPDLVAKHEKKKEASISVRALQNAPMFQQRQESGEDIWPEDRQKQTPPQEIEPALPQPIYLDMAELNRNVDNVEGDIANHPNLQNAWKMIAPLLPDGATLKSGWRSDNRQAKIILEYWLSGYWPYKGSDTVWRQNKGFFHTNFPQADTGTLRSWLREVRKEKPMNDRVYRRLVETVEPLRKIMTTYKISDRAGEPNGRLKIAPLGKSNHLKGLAFDVSGVSLRSVVSAAQYINKTIGPVFSNIEPEKGQRAVHLDVYPSVSMANNEVLATLIKEYKQSKQASKDPLKNINVAPGVKLTYPILYAWATLRIFLPRSAVLTSGFRDVNDQLRIIDDHWDKLLSQPNVPPEKKEEWAMEFDPFEKVKILNNNPYKKYVVARPNTSPHLGGKAMDVSGANLNKIEEAARFVSNHPNIPVRFSQILVEPNNNAVHLGIAQAEWDRESIRKVIRGERSYAADDKEYDEKDITDDLLGSNPPEDVLEAFAGVKKISWRISVDQGKLNIELSPDAPDFSISGDDDKVEDGNLKTEDKKLNHQNNEQEPATDKDLEVVHNKDRLSNRDWSERQNKFVSRRENTTYNVNDLTDADVKELVENNPKRYFYLGLNKDKGFKKYEYDALSNAIKLDGGFYFKFDYHKSKNKKIKGLLQHAAEYLAQQNPRGFFYYGLHDSFPELGRGAIVQLIDTNPEAYHDLGLKGSYPEYEEGANHARNIKDPHKVELEKPEWMSDEAGKPLSVREKNAELCDVVLNKYSENDNKIVFAAHKYNKGKLL